ncbi:MAG: isopeptide-forming domain-containing fimbrial protein, partial [Stomatobaculum sp.]|nr:isopeptide-forming domain-containing fimbrial protein [Stomatobaculum sp.]
MKKVKRCLAFLIATVMVLGMSTMALAASIQVSDSDTHEYKVYQVLTGTLSGEGSRELGDPKWGADAIANPGDVNTFITDITASGLSEAEIAAKVAAKVDLTKDGRGTVTKDSPLNELATGYYVLVDQVTLGTSDQTETKSLHVVKVLNNVTLTSIKYGTTEDKKLITSDTLGKSDSEDPNTYDPGVSNNNVSIGDTVSYNIEAKVPENADKFKPGTFFFVITDKLSDGLTFTEGSINVYDGETLLAADKYTVQYGINGNTFEIGLKNAASYKGHTINVKYDAVLNKDAVIGDLGNPNTSTVKFSNDPNKTYDGEPEDEEHPGFPD